MYLTSFFTNNGYPATGLTPNIFIWTLDGVNIINEESMTEIAGGFYVYDFVGYDNKQEYVFRAEDLSLPIGERYVIASNDLDSNNNQGIIKQILGLVQGNFVMSGQTYDSFGKLLTSNIYTYDTALDASLDVNRLSEYSIEANYDLDGNLIYYKTVEI